MNEEFMGPIVNNAYNSMMRATALKNHICVKNIDVVNKTVTVYREKMFTVSENSSTYTCELFGLSNRSTPDIKEMLQFIKFHIEIAINQHTLTKVELVTHKKAIEMIETEITERKDFEKVTYEFLLINLIKEKEYEIEQLKCKLSELKEK